MMTFFGKPKAPKSVPVVAPAAADERAVDEEDADVSATAAAAAAAAAATTAAEVTDAATAIPVVSDA